MGVLWVLARYSEYPGRDDERSKERAPCNAEFYLQRATCRVQRNHSKCNDHPDSAQPLQCCRRRARLQRTGPRMRMQASSAPSRDRTAASFLMATAASLFSVGAASYRRHARRTRLPAALAVPKGGAMTSRSACCGQQAEDYMQKRRCAQQLRKRPRRRYGQGWAQPRRRCETVGT